MSDVRTYAVPGRIEVLGKHTDYAGGKSLLAAIERRITFTVSPRTDQQVTVRRVDTDERITVALSHETIVPPGWSVYPATVTRRLAQDYPGVKGVDVVIESDLPMAAGLSSSSALISGLAIAILDRNELREKVGSVLDLASYLAAIETGVGTQGGSEDHTAILCCRKGELSCYAFHPTRELERVALPQGYTFAIGVSGVAAVKTGNAQDRYNRASRTSLKMITTWRETTKRDDASLGDVLASSPDAFFKFDQILSQQDDDALQHRWHQFNAEVTEIIPGVISCLKRNDVPGIGPFVDRSQAMAEMSLGNQIGETIALQRSARSLGAVAASAFGAGFGGSVWALVQTHKAENFLAAWRENYARTFSEAAKKAEFFLTRPGPGLTTLTP